MILLFFHPFKKQNGFTALISVCDEVDCHAVIPLLLSRPEINVNLRLEVSCDYISVFLLFCRCLVILALYFNLMENFSSHDALYPSRHTLYLLFRSEWLHCVVNGLWQWAPSCSEIAAGGAFY